MNCDKIEARKRMVSKKIGDMLLSGYKMLADSCVICNSVLMEDRRGVRICAFCDTLREEEKNKLNDQPMVESTSDRVVPLVSGSGNTVQQNQPFTSSQSALLDQVETTIFSELETSERLLEQEEMHNYNPQIMQNKIQHVKHIRECLETILVIRNLKKN